MFSIKSNEKSPDFVVLLVGGDQVNNNADYSCHFPPSSGRTWRLSLTEAVGCFQLTNLFIGYYKHLKSK